MTEMSLSVTSSSSRRKEEVRGNLRALPRAHEVREVYQHPVTRAHLGKYARAKGGREIWQLILMAIDEGFATRNFNCAGHNKQGDNGLTLRVLFTNLKPNKNWRHFINRYDLRNPRDRAFVRDVIWPIALANKAAVLADPGVLEELIKSRPKEAQKELIAEAPKEAPVAGNEIRPQDRIIIYGETFWPRPPQYTYTEQQVRAAVYFFQDLLFLCDQSPPFQHPESRAKILRFTTRSLHHYDLADRQVLNLVHAMALAMEKNPTGQCEVPIPPWR
jgi:hypothetical protein